MYEIPRVIVLLCKIFLLSNFCVGVGRIVTKTGGGKRDGGEGGGMMWGGGPGDDRMGSGVYWVGV